MGLFNKLGQAVKKGTRTAAGAAKNAAIDAAKSISPKKARKLSEKVIGKKNTDKIVDAGEKAHDTVENTVGKERLDATKKSAQSAAKVAIVGGPAKVAIVVVAGAATGFITKRDIIGDIADTLFDKDDGDSKKPENDDKKENKGEDKSNAPKTDDKDGGPNNPDNQRTDCFPDLSQFDDKANPQKPTPKPAKVAKKPASKPPTPK